MALYEDKSYVFVMLYLLEASGGNSEFLWQGSVSFTGQASSTISQGSTCFIDSGANDDGLSGPLGQGFHVLYDPIVRHVLSESAT